MKFSIATFTALAFLSASVRADSTSDAIAAFCDGKKKKKEKKP